MTITLDPPQTDLALIARLDHLAQRALRLDLEAKAAAAAFKEADAEFREALKAAGQLGPDFQGIGNVRTAISVTRRYNDDLAAATVAKYLTKKEQKECQKTVFDSALVKAHLSPIQFEETQKVYGLTVKYSLSDH